MNLIKLNATPSTNDYLKQLTVTDTLSDFTVVWADVQTQGKGQRGAKWITQEAKNLTFSIFIGNSKLHIHDIFTLNVIVSNAIITALHDLNLTNIWVKWPNDILSYNKKIAGILIENTISASGKVKSIIGIGINIDQTNFDAFPQASSIFKQYDIKVDKEQLLLRIVDIIKNKINHLPIITEDEWIFYHRYLFRKDQFSVFEDMNGTTFNGVIKQVNRSGQLQVELTNHDLKEYNLKDIKLIY